MNRIKGLVKDLFFLGLLPLIYRVSSWLGVKNRALLITQRTLSGPDDFAAVESLLEQAGVPCERYCLMAEKGQKTYLLRTLRLAALAAGNRFLLTNDSINALLCLPLRKESLLVQLWHACGAFKKWGYACLENRFGEDAKTLKKYYQHQKYTLVSVSSEFVVPYYEAAFGLEPGSGIVQALGVARTDRYFDPLLQKSAKEKVKAALGLKAEQKILLYAPTFRGELESAKAPEMPDLSKMKEKLGEDWVVILRQHPGVKNPPLLLEEWAGFAFSGQNLSMEELLFACDAAVTDYSSWIFEYALLGKPLFFFAPDLGAYDTERGFFLPYEEMIPAPFFETTDRLIEALQQGTCDAEKLAAFRETYMSACDGNAAGRIADFLLSAAKEKEKN